MNNKQKNRNVIFPELVKPNRNPLNHTHSTETRSPPQSAHTHIDPEGLAFS